MELQQERIMRYIVDRYGSEPDYPWIKYPDYAVFRHSATQKWFAVFLRVPKNKLGLPGTDEAAILNIKCSPLMTGSLLSEKGFLPAYHMNKSTWVSILLDDSVSDDKICPLLELSYDSVAPKRRKR